MQITNVIAKKNTEKNETALWLLKGVLCLLLPETVKGTVSLITQILQMVCKTWDVFLGEISSVFKREFVLLGNYQ